MEERSILTLKESLRVNLGDEKVSEALNNLVSAVIDSKILEIEKCVDAYAYCNPVFNDDIKVAIAKTPIGRLAPLKNYDSEYWQRILSAKSALVESKDRKDKTELESYANVGKKSELDKKPDEKQFNESPTLEAIKLLYETHPECLNIDFDELSKVKELSPDLQLLFKDSLKWDVVIHNTFNIREEILVELLRNMSEQDVSFICSIHNISDNFIEHYPELIDWDALLTFNRTPSEKTLFKCFKYIPRGYKSNAYKQLICKQIFENSKGSNDEE